MQKNCISSNRKSRTGVFINLFVFILAISGSQLFAIGTPAHKLCAGIFLGTYASAASNLFDFLVQAFRLGLLGQILWRSGLMSSILLNATIFFFLAFGVVAWITGWEGVTGVFYGFGVLTGIATLNHGLWPYVKESCYGLFPASIRFR